MKQQNLKPGSYAIIRWSAEEPEVICEILGYRDGMMLVRTEYGRERVLHPKSTMIIGLKEVYNEGH